MTNSPFNHTFCEGRNLSRRLIILLRTNGNRLKLNKPGRTLLFHGESECLVILSEDRHLDRLLIEIIDL